MAKDLSKFMITLLDLSRAIPGAKEELTKGSIKEIKALESKLTFVLEHYRMAGGFESARYVDIINTINDAEDHIKKALQILELIKKHIENAGEY